MAAGLPRDISQSLADGPANDISDALPQNDAVEDGQPVESKSTEPLTLDAINERVNEAVQPLQDSIAELRQENAFLRGAQLNRQQPAPAQPAPAEKPKSFREANTPEQALEKLRTDPFTTIGVLVQEAIQPLVDEIKGVTGRVTQSQQQSQLTAVLQNDAAELNEDFGHLKDNTEWKSAADAELNRMMQNGGYQPGMLYKAAARTYNRFVREGKLANGNTPAQNRTGAQVRQIRSTNSHAVESSVGARGGESATVGTAGADPRTIDDLHRAGHLTETDVRAAKKVMGRLGVSEADYVKNFMADKRANPRFGER